MYRGVQIHTKFPYKARNPDKSTMAYLDDYSETISTLEETYFAAMTIRPGCCKSESKISDQGTKRTKNVDLSFFEKFELR